MTLRLGLSLIVSLGLLLALAACGGQSLPSVFPSLGKSEPPAEEAEAKATPACKGAEKCAAHLKKLVTSPKREWVGHRQPADAYSDGTRLFAYRALKRKLTCAELVRAYEETRDMAPTLQGEAHAATRKLMAQVAAELRSERLQRCKQNAKS